VPTIYENVGNATSYGIELSAQWHPTSNWSIAEALSLQNPRFSGTSIAPSFNAVCTPAICKFNSAGLPSVSGNELPLVSQVTNDVEVDYLGRIDDWTYRIGVNETYRGMQYVDDINLTKIAAFWLTDAHATFGRDAFKVTLWTKNLFNREYVSSSFSVPSIYQYNANLGELRTYGVTLAVNF
jgi:outer membrane receptor protein involved in Fe transport